MIDIENLKISSICTNAICNCTEDVEDGMGRAVSRYLKERNLKSVHNVRSDKEIYSFVINSFSESASFKYNLKTFLGLLDKSNTELIIIRLGSHFISQYMKPDRLELFKMCKEILNDNYVELEDVYYHGDKLCFMRKRNDSDFYVLIDDPESNSFIRASKERSVLEDYIKACENRSDEFARDWEIQGVNVMVNKKYLYNHPDQPLWILKWLISEGRLMKRSDHGFHFNDNDDEVIATQQLYPFEENFILTHGNVDTKCISYGTDFIEIIVRADTKEEAINKAINAVHDYKLKGYKNE